MISGIAAEGTLNVKSVSLTVGGTLIFLALSFTFGRRIVAHVIRWTNDNLRIEFAVLSEPDSRPVHELRREVYRLRAAQQLSSMARNLFTHAARSSAEGRRDLIGASDSGGPGSSAVVSPPPSAAGGAGAQTSREVTSL